MNLNFDLNKIATVEFGVGKEDSHSQTFVAITVDADVQGALREMVVATWQAMQKEATAPEKYDPSEKHSGVEHLYLPLKDDMAVAMRQLHDAVNLPLDAKALADCGAVFCYFARMTDKAGHRLTALRRAAQFKGSLKSRFVKLVTDALKLVQDRVFKLDHDFDLLIDVVNIHILRPSSFEFAGKLQEAILQAVPENIAIIQGDLPFVEFSDIEAYATHHPRAARYLASIQSLGEYKNVDKAALKKLCKSTGVAFKELKGKIVIDEPQIMGFLEVLDRRRYELELVKGSPERFKAASRQKIGN